MMECFIILLCFECECFGIIYGFLDSFSVFFVKMCFVIGVFVDGLLGFMKVDLIVLLDEGVIGFDEFEDVSIVYCYFVGYLRELRELFEYLED